VAGTGATGLSLAAMGYRLLVTVVLVLHFGYLAFVVFGGFLAWRWPRVFGAHVLAAAWGLAVVTLPLECPLSWLEGWARQRAGQAPPTRGFIDRYIEGVLYPARYALLLQILVGLMVIGSWAGGYLYRRRVRRRGSADGNTGRKSDASSGRAATV
jgi:hypothetical protein